MSRESVDAETDRAYMRAASHNLHQSTIAFVDTTNPREGCGSGVLIEIAGRVFVATAAHTIPANPSGKISFVSMVSLRWDEGKLQILNCDRIPSRGIGEIPRPDVGFMELKSSDVTDVLKKSPISLDRVWIAGAGDPRRRSCTAGYPVKLHTTEPYSGALRKGFTLQCVADSPIAIGKWPEIPAPIAPPDPDVDVFVRYSLKDEMLPFPENTEHKVPIPPGMSGGGMWQAGDTHGKLWTGEHLRLFGIQSSWYEPGEYLRGTQIRHWLDLLCRTSSELRPIVEHCR